MRFCYILSLIMHLCLGTAAVDWEFLPEEPLKGHNHNCRNGFIPFLDSCYYIGVLQLTRYEAQQLCGSMRAKLVSIDSAAEDDFLVKTIRNVNATTNYWLGAKNLVSEGGNWVWDPATPWQRPVATGYTRWTFATATLKPGQDYCLRMGDYIESHDTRYNHHTWYLHPCDFTCAFICEEDVKKFDIDKYRRLSENQVKS